jgi:hypothetical protein
MNLKKILKLLLQNNLLERFLRVQVMVRSGQTLTFGIKENNFAGNGNKT